MERTTKLAAVNLALTAAMMLVCLIVGSVVGMIVGGMQYPETRWQENRGSIVISGNKERAAAVRGTFQTSSMWVGLIVAQSVFLVMYLEPRTQTTIRDVPKPEGA